MSWLPKIGWIDVSPEEAMELGLSQAGRVLWQMFRIEWLGCGITLMVRAGMTGNVIHLAFKSPHVVDDAMAFIACGHCRNKTFTMTEDVVDSFPLMRCAACGSHIGRMGWVRDDDPMIAGRE